ncbi:MAG: ubiquinol-cytochrome c reductase iron-sulfur subunit [Desulfurivibrio sp.]|jgi:cytochrome b6-f complex iron-sulfur subunit|nr:MAG: ubiquinol-cytochrome c reductase iron-sulfur subunit [Desulfurivibrio sp.]
MAEERRMFLQNSWVWVRLAAVAALCYPLLRFVKFKVPKKPQLVKVEKLMKVGDVHLDQEFVLFRDESGIWAVSRICTHLGCRLNFSEQEHLLICPCHQSRFTTRGVRISGPAERNLPQFAVEKMSGENAKGYIVSL